MPGSSKQTVLIPFRIPVEEYQMEEGKVKKIAIQQGIFLDDERLKRNVVNRIKFRTIADIHRHEKGYKSEHSSRRLY